MSAVCLPLRRRDLRLACLSQPLCSETMQNKQSKNQFHISNTDAYTAGKFPRPRSTSTKYMNRRCCDARGFAISQMAQVPDARLQSHTTAAHLSTSTRMCVCVCDVRGVAFAIKFAQTAHEHANHINGGVSRRHRCAHTHTTRGLRSDVDEWLSGGGGCGGHTHTHTAGAHSRPRARFACEHTRAAHFDCVFRANARTLIATDIMIERRRSVLTLSGQLHTHTKIYIYLIY